jgi:hypothetical protein
MVVYLCDSKHCGASVRGAKSVHFRALVGSVESSLLSVCILFVHVSQMYPASRLY